MLLVLLVVAGAATTAAPADDADATPRLAARFVATDLPGGPISAATTEARASLEGAWEFALEEDLVRALGTSDPGQMALRPWPPAVARHLDVPGCFTAQEPAWRTFVGAGWYRVVVDPALEGPAADVAALAERSLRFDGVARDARVYVDGALVATHRFSWVPFEAHVGAGVGARPFTLAVRVENTIPERGIPDVEWDGWWNHAGIFRDVALVARRDRLAQRAPVVRTFLRDPDDRSAGWTVLVFLRDLPRRGLLDEASLDLTVTLRERDGARRAWTEHARLGGAGGRMGVTFLLPPDAPAWSPDAPNLLTMEWTLAAAQPDAAPAPAPDGDAGGAPDGDAMPSRVLARGAEAVGLRDLRVRGPHVLLNGERLRLWGLCYHEVYRDTGYLATRERLRADLLDIKALGANFLRAAHYPLHPEAVAIADEIGLAVWQEIPAWKTSVASLTDPAVLAEWALPYLRAMVLRDLNRPSVFFWSVGNEFDSDDARLRGYIRQTTDAVRALDPTRLVSFASDRRLDDACLDLVDVIGINEYFGWYYGRTSDLGPVLDELAARHAGRPILVTEFGAGSILGLMEKPPGSRRDYSEPRQAARLESHARQMFDPARADFMLGAAWWLYRDFDDPHRTERNKPVEWHRVNLKGLRTREDATKMSYERFRALSRRFGFLAAPDAAEAP